MLHSSREILQAQFLFYYYANISVEFISLLIDKENQLLDMGPQFPAMQYIIKALSYKTKNTKKIIHLAMEEPNPSAHAVQLEQESVSQGTRRLCLK